MSLCPHGYSANWDCPICPCACGARAAAECWPGRSCMLDEEPAHAGNLDPARGIMLAASASLALWAVIAFAAWRTLA